MGLGVLDPSEPQIIFKCLRWTVGGTLTRLLEDFHGCYGSGRIRNPVQSGVLAVNIWSVNLVPNQPYLWPLWSSHQVHAGYRCTKTLQSAGGLYWSGTKAMSCGACPNRGDFAICSSPLRVHQSTLLLVQPKSHFCIIALSQITLLHRYVGQVAQSVYKGEEDVRWTWEACLNMMSTTILSLCHIYF